KIYDFFYQAEYGIRDRNVTGVQTCALPILFNESLERLDEDVDLLLIEHSPGNLEAIMAAAAQRNAKGIIVVASSRNPNLSASDSRELVLTARDFGLRALGPAALGVINTDASISLNATPAPMPPAGNVGIFTQSAGVGTLVLSRAIERGLG